MGPLADHLVFGLALVALAGAALRVSSLIAPSGLERLLAAAALGAGAAVAEELALGLVDRGGTAGAVAGAAAATWLVTRLVVPARGRPLLVETAEWWSETSALTRGVVGGTLGLAIAYAAFVLRYPALGVDGVGYHLPEVATWVRTGDAGSVGRYLPDLPVGDYPLTLEVLLTWCAAMTRSFAFTGPLMVGFAGMVAAGAWVGARALRVPPLAAGLAAALLVTTAFTEVNGVWTDLPSLAWLVCAAALAAGARRRPAQLAPALVAAGLAVGTKTTALPLAAAALIAGGIAAGPRELRAGAPALVAAGALAAVAGGVWYVRNLAVHGTPFWPFSRGPWGDPLPAFVTRYGHSFLSRPRATLAANWGDYRDDLAGALLVMGAGIAAPVLARTRTVALAAALTAGSLLLWMAAPFSGLTGDRLFDSLSVSTIRYLLPTVVVAALALGLAAREGGLGGRAATALLAVAVALNLVRISSLTFPLLPSARTVLAGLAAGVAAGLLAGPAAARLARVPLPAAAPAAAAATLVLAGVLSIAAPGFTARHARAGTGDAPLVAWFVHQPGFGSGHRPIAGTPATNGALAGDRLRHPTSFLPPDEPCARTRRRAARGWVVVTQVPRPDYQRAAEAARACLAAIAYRVEVTPGVAVYAAG